MGVTITKKSTTTEPKTVFTDYEILKSVFYRPHLFPVFCQSLCDVIHSIFGLNIFYKQEQLTISNIC